MLPDCVRADRFPGSGELGILIPEKLARLLAAGVGDTVRLKVRTSYGVPNIVEVEVAGIIRPPFNSLDQTVFFVPMPLARELLTMDSAAREPVVLAKDVAYSEALARDLQHRFAPGPGQSLEVLDWRHYRTALVADIMDTRFLTFCFGILLLISIFIMNNSMSMTVFERMREFGTMRALGMSKDGLFALVSAEPATMGCLGPSTVVCWAARCAGISGYTASPLTLASYLRFPLDPASTR